MWPLGENVDAAVLPERGFSLLVHLTPSPPAPYHPSHNILPCRYNAWDILKNTCSHKTSTRQDVWTILLRTLRVRRKWVCTNTLCRAQFGGTRRTGTHSCIFIQSSAVEYFHGNNKFRTNCVTCTPHAIFALSYLHYNINPHDTFNTLRSRFLAHVHCSGVRETHNSVEECFDLFVFA